ncbi:unnamed protein product [Prorocentrum cordatum]|uniref:C3H1-type domain-containing protein n=1 Tax=Prorocentrum cordatum TaxID=2364126 RepID=A0ABN9V705_9DINO|nr:unnamed protein product [Polarella glacialis]
MPAYMVPGPARSPLAHALPQVSCFDEVHAGPVARSVPQTRLAQGRSAGAQAVPPQQHTVCPWESELPANSMGHAQGMCRPCLFFSQAQCRKGNACTFCHLGHSTRDIKKVRPSKKTRSWVQQRCSSGAPMAARTASEHREQLAAGAYGAAPPAAAAWKEHEPWEVPAPPPPPPPRRGEGVSRGASTVDREYSTAWVSSALRAATAPHGQFPGAGPGRAPFEQQHGQHQAQRVTLAL